MTEVVGDIVGTVIVDGVTYLLKKILGDAGEWLWQLFVDDDSDGVPDTPDTPWDTWNEEPDEWTPFDPSIDTSGEGESGSDLPPAVTSDPTQIVGDIVLMTPDGPIILYAEIGGEEYDLLVSQATEDWIAEYGALDKPYRSYSPSEAYLFIIAVGTIVGLVFKIFRRRKL